MGIGRSVCGLRRGDVAGECHQFGDPDHQSGDKAVAVFPKTRVYSGDDVLARLLLHKGERYGSGLTLGEERHG